MRREAAGGILLAAALVLGGCRLESDVQPTTPSSPTVDEGGSATPQDTPNSPATPSEDPQETETPGPLEDADTVVTMEDFAFDPEVISVPSDGTIGLENTGVVTHSFTVKGEPVDVDVAPGETALVEVAGSLGPGNYSVSCKYHAGQGMVAALEVEA